ncbi:MAG: hypothetical protein MUF78_06275 [Candidatus Edwardsbacteria bacterium]|jgi:hypothetical protein|nr:hypothetical protein [Candidatus Edwardsbacteria bacterium]
MTDPAADHVFEWTVHPVRESMPKAVIAIVFPVAVSALVLLWTRSAFWSGLGFVLLFASEFPFFIRTVYRFDGDGVTMKRGGVTIARKWEQVRSYYPDRNGVQLSPYLKPSWMENFRGVYLQYGRHKEEILEQLEQRLPQPAKQ